MAYAPQTTEFHASQPPPYPSNDTMNFGMQYKSEVPPPGPSPPYISQPPPPGVMNPQPIIVVQPSTGYLGHNPSPIQCPSCQQQVVTIVRYEAGAITWVISLVICFLGGFIGCCLIPFCIPACQDAVHTCPACHTPLGRRSPF